MAFRDQTQALRARIEALQGELGAAQDDLDALESDRRELPALRARVAGLEKELAKLAPTAAPTPTGRLLQGRNLHVAGALGLVLLGVGGAVFVLEADLGQPSIEYDGTPQRGVIHIDATEVPAPPLMAAVTGEHAASELASQCTGYVPSRPLVTLRTQTARQVWLWTESTADLVLVVRNEDGTVRCDDDSDQNLNPRLALNLPVGEHDVWVGTFVEGERANFTLHIGDQASTAAELAIDGAPTLETIRVAGVERYVLNGQATGAVHARDAHNQCLGLVPSQAQVHLDVVEPGRAQIVARSSDEDLVLLVRRPDGTFICDDDGAGEFDPRLVEELQIGRYRIWVGTYLAGRFSNFQLSIDVDAPSPPDPDAALRLGRWDLGAESVLSFTERVEGRAPISSTQPACRTFFGGQAPDLELALGEDRTVTLSLTSEARLGMLIEHPDGTQSCDTAMRSQPVAWSAGTHRVWIGAPAPGVSAPFTLMVQTQPR